MDREKRTGEVYKELFGAELDFSQYDDPELMEIMQKFIFGDVCHTGNLELATREMITVVVLATMQMLPQLKVHLKAAMKVGNTPLQIREALYQCMPFIGVPKTLNAITVMNEIFRDEGVVLPLEKLSQVNDHDRYEKGLAVQYPIYGNEIKEKYQDLPANLGLDLARFLTEWGFGDFYTRGVLDEKERELYMLAVLTALRAETQIRAHALGCLKVGHSLTTIYSMVIHCLPYIGIPAAFKAINLIKEVCQ